ncbi:MAG: bifunctional lysylphosphatidylglycerol flippase/synthetase MprF [Amaricoccus sp.]|uniref:bifunctional lysylphosphatidylglycerol flippase/synthetase MprF n=1 Tax=Amaricoccus sp. TaxID=1872485 RepID=UPI0039E31D80
MSFEPDLAGEEAATPARGPFGLLSQWAQNRRSTLWAVFSLMMVALALFALVRLASETSYGAVVAAIMHTSPLRLIAAVVLTAVSFLLLTLYDYHAFEAMGRRQPWVRIAPGAVAAYAVAQTTGFGPLSGGAIRMRYYTPLGFTTVEIARVVVFVTAAFGIGVALTGAVGAFWAGDALATVTRLPVEMVHLIAGATLAGGALLVVLAGRRVVLPFSGGREVELPSRSLVLRQIAVTALETAAAAGTLWVLMPSGTISYAAFLPVYTVALVLGILSHVPAGLGVFEAVLLAALGGVAPPAELLAAFALYRLIYQVLPLALSSFGLALAEGRRLTAQGPAAAALRAMGGLVPQVLAAFALVLGTMLVFSAVTPARGIDLEWLASFLPLTLIEGAHLIASILGAVLMISARGLAFRLDGAWWAAMVASLGALVLSLVKAVAVYEAATLALFAGALFLSHHEFNRRARLLAQTLSPPWIAAVAVVMIAAWVILHFVFRHAQVGTESFLRFEISAQAPRGIRAFFGASLFAGLAAIWSLLRPVRGTDRAATPEEIARAVAIVEAQPVASANLVRMGDKRLLFSEDGRGFVMYGRQGRSWIALFDPVGPLDVWPELIWRFVESARQAGARAVFYETSPEQLALYADAGLRFYKMGEQARVDLEGFSLTGGKKSGWRNTLSRGAREGLAVEILPPEQVPEVAPRLRAISDHWLGERGAAEKGFSLGAFETDYVCQQPVAVMRSGEEIVAFASLMTTSVGEEVAIDLMRHEDGMPNIAMEFLFLRLCEILKEQGVRWFDLGMAPLSGFTESDAAPLWHRLGRAIYEEGVPSYNFKGLRSFKNKLQPEWRARYLAVAGGAAPALVLLDATRLIGRRPKEEK